MSSNQIVFPEANKVKMWMNNQLILLKAKLIQIGIRGGDVNYMFKEIFDNVEQTIVTNQQDPEEADAEKKCQFQERAWNEQHSQLNPAQLNPVQVEQPTDESEDDTEEIMQHFESNDSSVVSDSEQDSSVKSLTELMHQCLADLIQQYPTQVIQQYPTEVIQHYLTGVGQQYPGGVINQYPTEVLQKYITALVQEYLISLNQSQVEAVHHAHPVESLKCQAEALQCQAQAFHFQAQAFQCKAQALQCQVQALQSPVPEFQFQPISYETFYQSQE